MPLTYKPFAEVPAVEELSHELHAREPEPGLGKEGWYFLGGALCVLLGLGRRGLGRLVFLLAGGELLRRSLWR